MGGEVWGTVAVNDHCQPGAFLREVLLFDRLVIPVPSSPEERDRWRHPNPHDPAETWDPDALDAALSVLGTQRRPSKDGTALAWEAPWNADRWQAGRSRPAIAAISTIDPFAATRMVLAVEEEMPAIVEAVAAYPSEAACYGDVDPQAQQPEDVTAAEALVLLARPILVPDLSDGDYPRALHEAAALAREPMVQEARAKYHDWLRDYVSRLWRPGLGLADITLHGDSVALARTRLYGLVRAQEQAMVGDSRRSRWGVAERAMTMVGVLGTVGLALTAPDAAIGAGAALFGFGGWIAGKKAQPPVERPLNGASLFSTAHEQLEFFPTPPTDVLA